MRNPPEGDAIPQEALMLAYLCVKDEKRLENQVHILDQFGLSDAEIAQVCAAATGSVRNARSKVKKQSSGRQKRAKQ